MSSPFPGMDPYLEDPHVFPDLHNCMVNNLKETLQPSLPMPYFAAAGERMWVEVTGRQIEPDISISRAGGGWDADEPGGVAVATPPRARPVLVSVPHDERREPFLEVYTRQDGGERLVTVIEVLSPTNKTPGEKGRGLYQRKQEELLDSQVNLVEIDLLRSGEHTTAAPEARILRETGPFDYHVCVRRFYDRLGDFHVYPIRLEEALPLIAIPLLAHDEPVTVDLQAVFDHCYEAGPYRRRINYQEDSPIPPLTPKQQAWAESLLRSAGRRD